MAAYARCKVCGFKIEAVICVIYDDPIAGVRMAPNQQADLVKRIAEHIKTQHPDSFVEDVKLQKLLQEANWVV